MAAADHPDTLAHGHLKRHALIVEFGDTVLNTATLQDVFDDAVVKTAEGTGAERCRLMRYRPEFNDMLVCAATGCRTGTVGSPERTAANSPAGRSFRTGLPVYAEDLSEEGQGMADEVLTRHGIASPLYVPIRISNGIFGSLEVESETGRRFPADSEFFLRAIANLIGLAVMRASAAADIAAVRKLGAASAAEHTTMLCEMRHRMANGLQTILSTLNAEVRETKERSVLAALERVTRRVVAIGKAHARLDDARLGGNADLDIYLAGLCADIMTPPGIRMETELLPVKADHGTALPIGLIVNEAVTNCLKHAFPHGHGRIHVRLNLISEKRARVSVLDDGVGPSRCTRGASGTDIMNSLARSIGGTIMRSAGAFGGTTVIVEFPTHN